MTRRQVYEQKKRARKKRQQAFLSVLCVFVVVFSIFSFFSIADDPTLLEETTVIVQPGDTLWSIAQKRYGEDANIRKWIGEIRTRNAMDSDMLSVGDKLILPATM